MILKIKITRRHERHILWLSIYFKMLYKWIQKYHVKHVTLIFNIIHHIKYIKVLFEVHKVLWYINKSKQINFTSNNILQLQFLFLIKRRDKNIYQNL